MDELKHFCSKCKKCRLSETRTNVVFGEGNENADLLKTEIRWRMKAKLALII